MIPAKLIISLHQCEYADKGSQIKQIINDESETLGNQTRGARIYSHCRPKLEIVIWLSPMISRIQIIQYMVVILFSCQTKVK